ncbi:TonB-dependent receptor [Spongiibacter sp. KMU-166]|uniref:TonB-dependent receptor n=1 Tax=Spongiibacter thalassae TaxID=2721624 RepID=A0ABX1GI17_9GAMM|nr:TonB-dependent receptor [Spongiibacter thalassae]NKI18541.1 TonB-dependent receptor [Spongiibacter thalassae]
MKAVQCGIGVSCLLPSLALAANNLALEEVLVTAQKREQSAMTVPVTVDTFTTQDLENTGALTMSDIQAYIPGLKVGNSVQDDSNVTQSSFVIRGIKSSNISTGGDPSVATFLDGVYLPRAAITVPFSDIERVEVLKGPQGTLFGRNAAAGVVNFISNAPSLEEAYGFGFVKGGNYELLRGELMGNLPLNSAMALRVNMLHNQRAAVTENEGPAKPDPGEQDNQFARVAFLWEVNDRLRTLWTADIDRVDNGPEVRIGISEEHSNYPDPSDRKLNTDAINAGESRDMEGLTGKLWYDFGDSGMLSLIASYRQFDTYNLQDEDGTAVEDVYVDTNNEEDSNISYFELQYNVASEWADIVVGVNYSTEDTFQRTSLTFSYGAVAELASSMASLPPGVINALLGSQLAGNYVTETMTNTGDFQSYGVYTDMDFSLTEKLNVIVGLRYSRDDKAFTWFAPLTDFPLSQAQGENFFFNSDGLESASESWGKVTGRGVLNYQLGERAMVFASYSTGYKSGGYDSLNPGSGEAPLEPEVVQNYELGVKGDFLESRIRTQAALFHMTIDDRQEAIESRQPGSSAAVPTVINTDEELQGIELTFDWLITESVRAGIVYTYREQDSSREAHFDAQGEFVEADNRSESTPQEYTLSLDWSPETRFGLLLFHVDYIFEENTDPENEDHIDEFNRVNGYGTDTELLNARIALTLPSGDYEFALWGKNLLDNGRTSQPGGLTGDVLGTYHVGITPPPTYGLDLKVFF